MRGTRTSLLLLLLSMAPGCDRAAPHESEAQASPTPSIAAPTPPVPTGIAPLSEKISRPAPPRLVALGDLHGDLDHARRALRLAGAIDAHDVWIGGKLTVVQTGDEIDRGDDDRAILDLFDKLKVDARKAGGEVIALLGNHEIMNTSLDFRYVTAGGFSAFSVIAPPDGGAIPADVQAEARGRAAAFEPGGIEARTLAGRPIVMKVGDSVFVHGGVLPKHVAYGLDKMNDEVDAWLLGKQASPPAIVVAEDGPVWTRLYSEEATGRACKTLSVALDSLGAKRMVVGHTVQKEGITNACDGKVWRIDVGMSRAYGGPIQVLEIAGDKTTVLRETQ